MSDPTPISDAIKAYVIAEITATLAIVQAGSYPGEMQARRISSYQEIRNQRFKAMQKELDGLEPTNDR